MTSELQISFKTNSTKSADSVCDKPTFLQTAPAKSARVTVLLVIIITYLNIKNYKEIYTFYLNMVKWL
ncbi:protein of unknown function [Bartonella clarridgeiae 73]|uniref:Uncharacterized protein n=1 Tax=Bartonella clarridgeiae (strain CCUG 45776 / CIP 104772 / 73) TaxID=696125 RepID=E6YI11_BARC7|nr:protein of unknown function [Bartonella clarridgeiae 73]